METRVAIVTDSDLMASGARSALAGAPSITWVGHTADRFRIDSLNAHVLLIDESWTAVFGDVTCKSARIIFIGVPLNGRLIADRLAQDAAGYLHRADDLMLILSSAVLAVRRGQIYLSPTAMAEYLCEVRSPVAVALTVEARSVLRLLMQGMTVGAIAMQMGVTVRRVYHVRDRLRRRFGVITNEHLIRRAMEEGLWAGLE